jgi:hypothetical protein
MQEAGIRDQGGREEAEEAEEKEAERAEEKRR